jgi:hypothetical protein
MTHEPYWKLALNWGAVVTFLTLPLIIMTIQLAILSHPDWIADPKQYEKNFNYLLEFQRNLAILVFGLAGLRSFESYVTQKNGNQREEKQSNGKTSKPSDK